MQFNGLVSVVGTASCVCRPTMKVTSGSRHRDDHVMDTDELAAGDPAWTGGTDTLPGKRKRGMRDKGGNSVDPDLDDFGAPDHAPVSHMDCADDNG